MVGGGGGTSNKGSGELPIHTIRMHTQVCTYVTHMLELFSLIRHNQAHHL